MVYTVSTDLILRRMSRNRKNSIPPSNTRDLTEFPDVCYLTMLEIDQVKNLYSLIIGDRDRRILGNIPIYVMLGLVAQPPRLLFRRY